MMYQGGDTIAQAQPASAAWRILASVSAAVWPLQPATTRTRPRAASTAPRKSVARSSAVKDQLSPVQPLTTTPCTPSATTVSVSRPMPSTSSERSLRNGVVSAGKTPRNVGSFNRSSRPLQFISKTTVCKQNPSDRQPASASGVRLRHLADPLDRCLVDERMHRQREDGPGSLIAGWKGDIAIGRRVRRLPMQRQYIEDRTCDAFRRERAANRIAPRAADRELVVG